MKYLQMFNIYIWKKFFQINLVINYFGGTSLLQFHTNQTTKSYKTGVISKFLLVSCIYSRCLCNKDMNYH